VSHPVIVIGSGLTGIAATWALLRRGLDVVMMDGGLQATPEAVALGEELAAVPAWQWTDETRGRLTSSTEATLSGVTSKKWLGSDFASALSGQLPQKLSHARFYASEARCGLGNIWGCGMLPMLASDMDDWPISLADLEPHYREVLQFVPLGAYHDALEKSLPLYCEPKPVPINSQGKRLLARMEKRRGKLEEAGITFGAARLAGDFSGHQGNGCQLCGMCMYGCPYGVLYSGQATLSRLLEHERFRYIPGYLARSVEQRDAEVRVHGVDPQGTRREPVAGSRVIVCAGVPATAYIMLNTLRRYRQPVRIKTCEHCYIPMLSCFSAGAIEHEAQSTTCQAFWLLRDKEVHPRGIHFSLYGYNSFYLDALKNTLGKLYPAVALPAAFLIRRLFFAFCYLHSDASPELHAELRDDTAATLHISGLSSQVAPDIFRRVRKRLMKISPITGLLPLPFYSGTKLPGEDNHLGGAFPMSKSPGAMECDILGRFHGLERVHVADASCFPSITATTITLSAMANAHRIACHAAELERT
jgi:choline dehydrogenase-like flavoprotein